MDLQKLWNNLNWLVVLGIIVAIEQQLANGTMSIEHTFPPVYAPAIKEWAANLATIGTLIMSAGAVGKVSMSATNARPSTLASLLLAVMIGLLAFGGEAHAQIKKPLLTGNVIADIKANTATAQADGTVALQDIYDFLHKNGRIIIADMTKAKKIAGTQLPDPLGGKGHAASEQCLAAAIPIAQLIVDNEIIAPGVTPAADANPDNAAAPDGIVTVLVKALVVAHALQDDNFNGACAWLKQSVGKIGSGSSSQVFAGLIGLAKLPLPLAP